MRSRFNRRRFIRIAAATASCGLAGVGAPAFATEPAAASWRGIAMGSLASIEVRHSDPARAKALLAAALEELQRLEAIMSLYRPQSALSTLNRDGILRDPPFDLVRVLTEAQRFGHLSAGRFDVTVQPLWTVYADHFLKPGADPKGPAADLIRKAAALVDYRAIAVDPDEIRFAHPGMQVTLNGIAQGYITDRIADLFRREGLEHALVDLGEIAAVGARDNGRPWTAGIENPMNRDMLLADVPLVDAALATSGGYGFRFDPAGHFHHLFDPATGACPQLYASVSVVAANATAADALATAANLLAPDALERMLRDAGAARALVIDAEGAKRWLAA
ncbi:FAD:protein FMN transferase [Dongia sp.]|uniref:FAD:protein FMN transferase n=1 Tax=Dongia sp. TaxID=1977262 RepID=UPI003753B00F